MLGIPIASETSWTTSIDHPSHPGIATTRRVTSSSPDVMTFETAWRYATWRPIRNCPGRFAHADGPTLASPAELLGVPLETTEHAETTARDTVVVARFEGGGLISYRRPDGHYLHTLNDAAGLARKLHDLGIIGPAGPKA